MFIDSHTHLTMGDFEQDRDEVIGRASRAGVGLMVTVGTNLDDSREAISLAGRYESVYATIGVHPHDVKEIVNLTYDCLKELKKSDKVVAYGEIGLDFFRNLSPKEVQIRRFGEQLELARELHLPIIVHDRNAHREILEMLKGWRGRGGVFHCFSGDYDMAKKCLDMGFYISIPGTVTFENAGRLQEVTKLIPLTGILIETDAPYLSPHPHRGKRNESAYIVHTAQKIAQIKGLSLEEVEMATSQNARVLFNLGKGNIKENQNGRE
ncbi:MAG: hydrolase TatD [Syntrophobacterales bacterium CG_4_9_14_3_um_filter_49_8]|nr:MAG: hydrolase TatD [Syntrophobacterales bacterium CG23_combo_of_CG06-09_8_20_14_all_48_27]PJA49811.1 MAG: hydrolase TatD [Syntrophobacterales bacterium CG_4_9_14_3_um_filter_49_8]